MAQRSATAGWHRPPFLVAHRGWSSEAPENTLLAFERAVAAGAEVLEGDLQLTRDGVVVVIHDPRVDRTTDGSGAVRELSWEEIRRLDAGYGRRFGDRFRGERVPRLEQLLELARGRAQLFLEIKPEAVGEEPTIEEATLQAVRDAAMDGDVGVLSFAPVTLRRVRRRAPGLPLGLVFRRWRRQRLVEETLACGADYMVCPASALAKRPELVGIAHARGLRAGVYVADDEAAVRFFLDAGVDGITTNRVGEMLPLLAGRKGAPAP